MFALVNKAICYFSFVLIIYMLKLDYVVKPIHPRPATLPQSSWICGGGVELILAKRRRLLVSSFKVWKKEKKRKGWDATNTLFTFCVALHLVSLGS